MSSIAAMENKMHTVNSFIKSFEEELNHFYPMDEIKGFIRWSFYHVCGYSSIDLSMKKDDIISPQHSAKLISIIERLKTYQPIQYILGETEFYGLKILVNPNVLIPRPETEELVDWIIKDHQHQSITILDIGTGSGCIAIALKKHLPMATIIAIDISDDALSLDKENALM